MVYLAIDVLVLVDGVLFLALVEHLPVPVLEPLRLRDLLLRRVAVEDVVVALRRWAGPDVRHRVAESPHVFQVAEQNLVVDVSTQMTWLEEVHRVEICDVHSTAIGRRAVAAVLLDVEAEEAHLHAVDHLEGEDGFRLVRELLRESHGRIPKRPLSADACHFFTRLLLFH